MSTYKKAVRRCEDKRQFATYEDAATFARTANLKGPNASPIKPYPCRVCKEWHNGRPPIVRELAKKCGSWSNAVLNMEWHEWEQMRDCFHDIAWLDGPPYLVLALKYTPSLWGVSRQEVHTQTAKVER